MTMTVNPDLRGAELAQAVAEYITAHPDEWNQDDWGYRDAHCGTQMCIAGTAALMTGRAEFIEDENLLGEKVSYLYLTYGLDFVETGAAVLDLDRKSAVDLFYNFQSYGAEGVGAMWHKLASLYPEGAITIPPEYL
jgi:hypothetical protein